MSHNPQAQLVAKQFKTMRAFILLATACKKPSQDAFGELLGPLQKDTAAILKLKDTSRSNREWLNHLQTVSDGAPCVGWVTLVRFPLSVDFGFPPRFSGL